MKFTENFRATVFEKRLHYCTTIEPQKYCEKPANRRAASDEKPTPDIKLFTTLLLVHGTISCIWYNRLKALFAKFTNHTRSPCNIYQDCGVHAYYAF